MKGGEGVQEQLDIDRLVRQYGTMVLRQAYLYLKDRQRAEDVCQEVFLRLYKKQPDLPDEQSEKAEGYDAPSPSLTPESKAMQGETRQQLYDAVMDLPPIYKDVVLLFYYNDLPTGEIARILAIPEVTVRTRLMRARTRLGNTLRGSIKDDGTV